MAAADVIELLITTDADRAQTLAEQLDALNADRQRTEAEIVQSILEECSRIPVTDSQAALVFAGQNWHRGVLGIVASFSDVTRQHELQQTKNDVISLVSHEMRTPLTAVLRRIVLGAGVLLAASAVTTRAAAQELRDAYHQAPRDTVTQEVYDGWKQFNLNCARCHGEDALGTSFAPHLIVSLKPDGPINTKELFMQTVCAGRPEKGMPSWCALGMEIPTIDKIYSYVKARSNAKMAPGRPAVKRQG
jgi:mono/diheme cytochrome c family protein